MHPRFGLTCSLLVLSVTATAAAATSVAVHDKKIGTTQKYSGVNVHPYSTDAPSWLEEMGINWVRVLNHSIGSRSSPFSGVTIDQVKANPARLDWSAVDSFYSYDRPWLEWAKSHAAVYTDGLMWNGNTTADSSCDRVHRFTRGNASDENLYWVGIFAYAYWANVKNQLHMTHVEVSNEPDNCDMGVVPPADHGRMVELAKDALTYVNTTLVSPALPAVILGPGVLSQWGGREWLTSALTTPTTAQALDVVSFHAYWESHWTEEIGGGADYIRSTVAGRSKPIWISEWGQFWTSYNTALDVHGMAATIPKFAELGVEAAAIYELSPWDAFPQMGLVAQGGVKTRMYWDVKLLNRALSFEKDMLETTLPNAQSDTRFVYATRDTDALYLIVLNNDKVDDAVTIDVSALGNLEGKTVSLYEVPGGAGPYAERTDPTTTVRAGAFTVQAKADTHYVAVVSDAGAAAPHPNDAGQPAADAADSGSVIASGNDASAALTGDAGTVDSMADGGQAGCACRTHGAQSSHLSWPAALMLLLAAAQRRRRRFG